ncbi:MAG: ABC transporter permease, partial [Chitinophagaceae bacterium]
MFRNYFKTALRNLLRYKGFAFINILSLTIGIVGCLVIGLFVWDEQQFDKSIPNGENIYRIYEERKDALATTFNAPVPPAYADFLQRTYPEVESTARIMMLGGDKYLMERGEKRAYEEKGIFVDSSFFSMFSLQFKSGNPATALNTTKSIVLTEELAQRYFSNEDPIGKTIFINKDTLEVKGVLAALPSHFHLNFRYLMPIAAVGFPKERMEKWGWHQFYTYIKLKPGVNATLLQDKFRAYVSREIMPKESTDGSSWLP